ncbi:MAG: CoA pyrophosphatase [Saprospiraceae bacterium]|nr:CoA pyrophosphatase [Saprospiraceae bacterium]
MLQFVNDLERKIKKGLPGRDAQLHMAPSVRKHYMEAPDTASTASVLALFYPKEGQNHLVLIERQTKKNDRHGGQISLPGGKTEPTDAGHDETALREAEEEVGVKSNDVELIGSLTELYIPVSNFKVFPFVGFMDYRPDFVPQLSEVKSILEIPFDEFLHQSARKTMDMQVSQHITMRSVPYFDVQGRVVWGATAMILSELISIANQ